MLRAHQSLSGLSSIDSPRELRLNIYLLRSHIIVKGRALARLRQCQQAVYRWQIVANEDYESPVLLLVSMVAAEPMKDRTSC